MTDQFSRFRNPDGTYNGVEMLSHMSGLSAAEVTWSFNRLKHLLHVEKKTKEEAKAIVREEAKSTPWITP